MTPAEFKRSLANAKPPDGVSPALAALWWAGKDDWNKAHKLVMSKAGADCAWVHAYLHRVEGDLDNARYWYRKARRMPPSLPSTTSGGGKGGGDLAAEWKAIAAALLTLAAR